MKILNKNNNDSDEPLDSLDWTIEEEVKLFYALRNHKPVGNYRVINDSSVFLFLLVYFNFTKC